MTGVKRIVYHLFMPRPITYPNRVQFQLAAGKTAAVEAHRNDGEHVSDQWRRIVDEWLDMADKRRAAIAREIERRDGE